MPSAHPGSPPWVHGSTETCQLWLSRETLWMGIITSLNTCRVWGSQGSWWVDVRVTYGLSTFNHKSRLFQWSMSFCHKECLFPVKIGRIIVIMLKSVHTHTRETRSMPKIKSNCIHGYKHNSSANLRRWSKNEINRTGVCLPLSLLGEGTLPGEILMRYCPPTFYGISLDLQQ